MGEFLRPVRSKLIMAVLLCSAQAAFAQQQCADDTQLFGYLTGGDARTSGARIARYWKENLAPQDMTADERAAVASAVVVFEDQESSAEEVADLLAAGVVEVWANLISREQYVAEFLAEARNRSSAGSWSSILQAAQFMQNRVDDLYGAAGSRERPDNVHRMWWWDSHIRNLMAERKIDEIVALPDGQWLWNQYLLTRKSAIACSMDVDATRQEPVPQASDQGLSDEEKIALGIAAAIALWAVLGGSNSGESDGVSGDDSSSSGGTGSGNQSVPACGRDFKITPSKMPCGNRWAPRGNWPEPYWCYTDFNMQLGGVQGVTYCTDGAGVWQRSRMTDPCSGAKGWCDNYGMGPLPGFFR